MYNRIENKKICNIQGDDSIKQKHIAQIHYKMNIGITEPKFAILDDGSQVIVKLSNGPEGNLVLLIRW